MTLKIQHEVFWTRKRKLEYLAHCNCNVSKSPRKQNTIYLSMWNHLQQLLTEFMLPPEPPSRQQYIQSKGTCSSERDQKMQPVRRKQRARKRFAKYKLSWSKHATHSSAFGSKKVIAVIWYNICYSGTLGISNCRTTYTLFEKWFVQYLILLTSASDVRVCEWWWRCAAPLPCN